MPVQVNSILHLLPAGLHSPVPTFTFIGAKMWEYSLQNCQNFEFWPEICTSRAPFLSSPLVSGMDCHLTLRRPRHCLHSRDASRLNCLHGAIPIAPAASDFPFRLLVDAVTHVFSVFRVCKVP